MIRLAALLCFFAFPVMAHSWYDRECCNTTDCAPMSVDDIPRMIDVGPEGITVRLERGDHPIFPEAHGVQFFPWDDHRIRYSQDDNWHVCVADKPIQAGARAGEHFMFCVYMPPFGL